MNTNSSIPKLEPTLRLFSKFVTEAGIFTEKTSSSYVSYIRNADAVLGNMIMDYIFDYIGSENHLECFMKKCDSMAASMPAYDKVRPAVKAFALYIFGTFYADDSINLVFSHRELAQFVAKTAIFVTTNVIEKVKCGSLGTRDNRRQNGNIYASWDGMTSTRYGKVGNPKNGKRTNTSPNYGLKCAILESLQLSGRLKYTIFQNYEVCHIWNLTDDPRYFASIQNLVLIPRSIAGLTDHNEYVKSVLRYRAYKLFGFNPMNVSIEKPTGYEYIKWKPLPF